MMKEQIPPANKAEISCNLFEEAPDSFFVLDKSCRILDVNISASKLTGYSKDELAGKDYVYLFSDDHAEEEIFDTVKVEAGMIEINERKILNKNGYKINVELRTKKLSDGNYLSTARDITARILIRTQLESKNQELEKAYSQVIDSEKKYRQLFRNIPLGIITATSDGKIESINIQMAEILGSDSTDRSRKFNLFELPTLKGSKFIEDFKITLSEGISHHKIYDYTSVWNKKTSLRAHILPLDNDGPRKVLVLVEDYTKEREKENRLKILSQGVNNSPASIVVTDAQGRIKFVNKSFIDITGYNQEEIIDNKPSILKSGYHGNEFYKNLWETILSGKEWVGEFRNRKKNGELYWESAMISALKDEKGRITNFMAIKEDITKKKQVEKDLKDKTEQLQNLLNNSPDSICFKEADGRWILANTAMLEFFGIPLVNYQGKSNEELIKSTKKESDLLQLDHNTDLEALAQGRLLQYEVEGTDNEANKIVMEISKLPLYDEEGKPKSLVNIGRDITRRKRYEQELEIARQRAEEADHLKSAFLANMSHEIRTPLNAIIGFSSLLADYNIDKESFTRFVDIIQVNGKKLLTIIDDILLISKLQVNQIKVQTAVIDLDQLLAKLHQQFSRELDILKEKEIDLKIMKNITGVVKIVADRDKLSIIYSKLIRNAIKFTTHGRIDFGFDLNHKGEISFFVKDTGVGISDEKKELIFQKFRQVDDSTTREYGGTGLGLSIVKGLIDLLKGNLWLTSEMNKGTEIYFSLPLESVEIEKEELQETEPEIDWTGKKVLIVDDVPESLFLLNEILKFTQVMIYKASNARQAIKQFTDNPDINLILMDIQLPEMSGLEAVALIRKINPDIPIIMQTAFGQDGYEQKSMEAGCNDIVFKPINPNHLIAKMNKYL